jgi:hypothetical protein
MGASGAAASGEGGGGAVGAEGWVCKGREEAMEPFGGKHRELLFALNFVIVCCVAICYCSLSAEILCCVAVLSECFLRLDMIAGFKVR